MVEILFIRHERTKFNENGTVHGYPTDAPLSKEGKKGTRRVARRLGWERGVKAVYSSDVGRTLAIARRVAAQRSLPVVALPLAREKSHGVFEGKPKKELEAFFAQQALKGVSKARAQIPGGETREDVSRRGRVLVQKLSQLHGEKDKVVVVSHEGLIRSTVAGMIGLPLDKTDLLKLENAAVVRVQATPGKEPKVFLGETSHKTPVWKRVVGRIAVSGERLQRQAQRAKARLKR